LSGSTGWTYRDWLSAYGEPAGEPYSADEARARYSAGERVTVLVGDPDKPEQYALIQLGGRSIEVVWLDALLRPTLTYVYAVKQTDDWPQDTLLLEQVHVNEYDNDIPLPDAEAFYNELYTFHPDGKFFGMRKPRGQEMLETQGQMTDEQFALQCEPVPAFGEWDSVLRHDRESA
jgi:hypothetical protein